MEIIVKLNKIINIIKENKIKTVYYGEGTVASCYSTLNPQTEETRKLINKNKYDWQFPIDLEHFYKNHNGGEVLMRTESSDGLSIVPLDDMEYLNEAYEIDLEGNLYPIAYLTIYNGFVCVNSKAYKNGEKHYLQWVKNMRSNGDEIPYLKCESFTDFLDSMIISQGLPFWLIFE